MPQPASMAICSTSSASAAAWSTSRTLPMRRAPSCRCRTPNPTVRMVANANNRPRRERRTPPDGTLECPGRSMFGRLKGGETGKGAAGKWTDAATGEHGDLLDVIRESCGLVDFKDVADEARTFLSMPHPEPDRSHDGERKSPAPTGSPEAARRLVGMSQPILGTVVEAYLRERAITALHGTGSLRFHPRCYYRPDAHSPTETWPAMIAALTDFARRLTGPHPPWPRPARSDKGPIHHPNPT